MCFLFQLFKCLALHPLFGDKVTRIVWDTNASSKRTNYHEEKRWVSEIVYWTARTSGFAQLQRTLYAFAGRVNFSDEWRIASAKNTAVTFRRRFNSYCI